MPGVDVWRVVKRKLVKARGDDEVLGKGHDLSHGALSNTRASQTRQRGTRVSLSLSCGRPERERESLLLARGSSLLSLGECVLREEDALLVLHTEGEGSKRRPGKGSLHKSLVNLAKSLRVVCLETLAESVTERHAALARQRVRRGVSLTRDPTDRGLTSERPRHGSESRSRHASLGKNKRALEIYILR